MNKVTFKAFDEKQAQDAMNALGEEYNIGTTSQAHISGRAVHIERNGKQVEISSSYFSQPTLEASVERVIEEMGLRYAQ